MRDQDLVNALRCVSTAGGPIGDCKKCPFCKTEPVPKNLKKTVTLTEWSSCDVNAVWLAAADRIANQITHIAALQQEIEKLRAQNEQLREAAALVTVEAAEKWDAEHPIKTRQSEFLKLFPYARVKKANGLPIVSPCDLDVKLAGKCEGIPCQECWKKFWLAEVENAEAK